MSMGLFSSLKNKLLLWSTLDKLPQYRDDVKYYIRLILPEDEWIKFFEEPPAVTLLKECLFNDAPAKKAAVIMMITGFGTRMKNFGPANPTAEYATFYLATMLSINKLEGVEENITV
jgi:hypothetical protein